jgi:indolepyruvate ferredoxin oxidoreductase beta subunit
MTLATQARDRRPTTILVAALGGQGGGLLAEWLVDAASRAGYPAQSTSIPGVAQRTGATTYYVEIFPVPLRELGGRMPVLSLVPVPGGIDLLVASELLEAARMVQAGFVDVDRTMLVTSTARTLTTAEKMSLGDGRYASDRMLAAAGSFSRTCVSFDMDAAAQGAGTVVSAVMFGAIAGSGVLPFGRDACEAAIDAAGVGAEGSRRGFARGAELCMEAAAGRREGIVARVSPVAATASGPHDAIVASFPPACRDIVAIGALRVAEFQDDGYAKLYLDRVAKVRDAEAAADPRGGHGAALTREAARFLALWMAFDDIARVADLKCRASRHARVRREVGAEAQDIVRVADFFKPGVPEFAGMLPPAIAQRLVAWDRRRVSRGRRPFALPLKVRADAVGGMLALRLLAGMRRWRRFGSRYLDEQAAIERWLASIVAAASLEWECAFEIALAGRLVKGYGETNLRGKRNLAHLLDHLATGGAFDSPAARTRAIREAREAALADEGGQRLDAALSRHGVPPRPAVAKPVVWMKKPASAPTRGREGRTNAR